MKVSIIIPVYYNENNLQPLYDDIKTKIIDVVDYDYELIMVNDGSLDNSWSVMKELAKHDANVKIYSLSRNFGSHAAILCGLSKCTGDCAVVKAADLQEPTTMILDMVNSWKTGNNVVLGVRSDREESITQTGFANLYYWITRKMALPKMPKTGFDVFLVDRKVIDILLSLDERNSALTGQLLWSGFKTGTVTYVRKARKIGRSRWTLRKKIRLVTDTLFSFSTVPIKLVTMAGILSFVGSLLWASYVIAEKVMGNIAVSGWTTLLIFNLFSFSMIMCSIGILGEYLWRTFDASRNRPPFIIEYDNQENVKNKFL